MDPASPRSPERFIADFFTEFTAAALAADADPAEVVDRFHAPEVVQIADGIRLDRDRLVAHLRPMRKNLRDYRFEVHEVIADGARMAARLTIHATMRTTGTVATEVFLFGEFTPDGKLLRADQLTRPVAAA
ncbi:nuclear transport factor 2 family protein [Nocardia sp. NPDC051833]|uniref:nuclear transport factor 2 family protein n=1 Tax=Nocardia sp. NPDC051833 TaxID=3155674 RepID=UPI00342439BF